MHCTVQWNLEVRNMAGSQKFFNSSNPQEWEEVFNLYPKALQLRASKITKPNGKKNLLELDKWFQDDLPKEINSRSPKYMTKEELTKLMKWKLARGKFRPRLTEMVQTNDEKLVQSVTTKAFQKVSKGLKGAIKELCVLKAVGPATASAILAAGAPEHAPFMADESMNAIPGIGPLKYTEGQYEDFSSEVKDCVKRLKDQGSEDWTPHKVELTLWTHYIINQMNPDLLKKLNSPKRTSAGGEQGKKRLKTS